MYNRAQFKKKTALVLGSKGLIGSEIVKDLKKLGCKILEVEKGINKIKSKNQFFLTSETDDGQIKEFSSILKTQKKIDIFINASYPKTKNWENLNFGTKNFSLFKTNISLHLNTYVWFSKMIAEKMKKDHTKGVILNFSSIYGKVSQDMSIYKGTKMRENIAYSAIKGGISNYTKLLAAYYGKYEIRANCICPGGILENKMNKKFIKNYSNRVPLGRLAEVKEISKPSIFLISEEAKYITGINLLVDGGWTCI